MRLEIPVPYSAYRSDYDQDKFIKLVKKYKENISCIYLPIGYVTEEACSFGIRNAHTEGGLAFSSIENLHRILFQELNVPVKILCNDLYAKALHENFYHTLKKIQYYSTLCTVKSVVIADYFLLDKFKGTNIPLCLSVNGAHGIEALSHVLLYDDAEQIKEICFDRDLNRNIDKVHDFIKTYKKRMKNIEPILLVNEGCTLWCPYKQAGDIEIVMDNSVEEQHTNIHTHGCNAIKNTNPWLFLASPLLTHSMLQRPEYQGFTIKIAGRNLDASIISGILEHYVHGTHLQLSSLNNINQLAEINTSQFTKEFEDTVLSCDKQCLKCFKCKSFYKEMVGK